ncbi:DUF4167 domain-containing protein [Pseudorhodobacter sp. W20_MBD10_FR17]|uniref:DUF4167 domain-containing protein n=1 Tax=Pseudorhodobacter sp. W20_MBD10_FR17 TaxID=3240266 RepID=UPI003F96BD96
MRSSKSRSRSKSNRPRTLGNITNRVFDSSGPEGKVRGTPQQIIEKYNQLSRDAQLSNDRVNAENFLQHAEHYTRMLAEAQREMQAEQEARRQQDIQNNQHQQNTQNQQRDRQQDRGDNQQPDLRDDRSDNRNEGRNDGRRDERPDNRPDNRSDNRNEGRNEVRRDNRGEGRTENRTENRRDSGRSDDAGNVPDVIEASVGDDDIGLVETPETRRLPRHRTPRPKQNVEHAEAQPAGKPDASAVDDQPKPARKPRAPRKPKAEAGSDGPKTDTAGDQAAE